MIRIAVCEDNREDMAQLRSMLYHTNITCNITEYTDAEEMMSDLERDNQMFDIFILDIFLPGEDGVKLASRIRDQNEFAALIFMSSSEEFYREAFDLYVLSYLVKPVKQEKLAETLKVAIDRMDRSTQTLQISCRGEAVSLRYRDICYIASSNHLLCFYMEDGREYTSYGKLDEIERRINSELIVRCHKSFIVNLSHVDKMTRDGFYIGKTFISISRTYSAEVRERYQNFLFGIFQDK